MKLTGNTVLLVEDEPIIGFALEDMMADEGANAVLACSLAEGLQLARKHSFDAAILDVNLHGQESYPLARELLRARVPVIFATGYGMQARPDDLAGVPTVTKPYDIGAIRAAFTC